MASELLKNRALIQKLKEPDIPRVNFSLDEVEVETLLPEEKPEELFEERERVRTERLSDTLTKIGGGLMDESVDFIKREEFRLGSGDKRAKRPERQAVSKYDINELNKAVKWYTDGEYNTWDEITKVALKSTQADIPNAPKKVKEAHYIRTGIRNNLKNNKGKFVVPDPAGGQFKPVYFTDYSDKAFLKDLKNKKGPYEIATDYYLKNKKFIQKQMIGNVEYIRPISYLAKVLTKQRKKDPKIAKELKNYRAWANKQKGPKTQREYIKRIEKLLPQAIENGLIPKEINTSSKYFQYVNKQKIDPLRLLFNNLEKIGVEHIAGISRAVDISDYRTLAEIVPLLGGKEVNFEKGLLYDRPMTGLAKNILRSDNLEIQKKNLKALNNMSKEAAEMYNTLAVKYKLSSTDENPIGGQMLERITKGEPLDNTLLRDADLLMKQYVDAGGASRKSFKNIDPRVQEVVKLYEEGDLKEGRKKLRQAVAAIACPGKAMGGRIGFQDGAACFEQGRRMINTGNIPKGAGERNFIKFFNTASSIAKKTGQGLRLFTKLAIIPEAAILGIESAVRMSRGDTLSEALKESISYIPGLGGKAEEADLSRVSRYLGKDDAKYISNLRNFQKAQQELKNVIGAQEADLALSGTEFDEMSSGESQTDVVERYKPKIAEKEKALQEASISKPEELFALSREDEFADIKNLKRGLTGRQKRQELNVIDPEDPLSEDLITPEITQEELNKRIVEQQPTVAEEIFGGMAKATKTSPQQVLDFMRSQEITEEPVDAAIEKVRREQFEKAYGDSALREALLGFNIPEPVDLEEYEPSNRFEDFKMNEGIYSLKDELDEID